MVTQIVRGFISQSWWRGTIAPLPGLVMLALLVTLPGLGAQGSAKVDFGRDVQPIFKTYCIQCHGPAQQMNGLRLDRRRDAMRGGTIAVIGPGNSAGSRLYLRVAGDQFGMRMPPTGPLPEDKIQIIKAWIDQGAEWPDALSGETPPPPPDAGATALMEALRAGDAATFRKKLKEDAQAARRQGPGGSTPLMYAALYGNAEDVRRLLAAGADPNAKNESGATALMWAVNDLEKTRLLVDHGAKVDVCSDSGRTPLMIAAARHGSAPILQLLLDHGANPSVQAPAVFGVATPLAEAAYASDEAAMRTLIAHGADVKAAGFNPLVFAMLENCAPCVEQIIGSASPSDLSIAALFDSPPLGEAQGVKRLVELGADPNARGRGGATLFETVCALDTNPVDVVKLLMDHGADVNAKDPQGETALFLAMRHGHTPVVDLLTRAGAQPSSETGEEAAALKMVPAHNAREAVERSLPLLQRNSADFMHRSGCVSCHNNTLTAMTVAAARQSAIHVDEETASQQARQIGTYLESWRDRALQGVGIPGDSDTIGEILLGLAEAQYSPDPATDAMAQFLKIHQSADGHWVVFAHRPPLESSEIQTTAVAMHDLQVYAPSAERKEYEATIRRAAAWIAQAQPRTTQDRAYQILGLAWAGAERKSIEKAAAGLLAEQRSDGGWAQLPTLGSDAFATGQALVALARSGALNVSNPAFQRGTQYLISTQLADGSWYVKRRALPIQPFFESGFPHGHDQFISAAATNWATTALAIAARTPTPSMARIEEHQRATK